MRFSLIFSSILLDQTTKALARSYLEIGNSVPVIPGVVYLTLHMNTGAAFGLFQDKGIFLTLTSCVFVLILIPYLIRHPLERQWPLLMVLAGALGNLIDRLWTGRVTDFIDLRVWPIFNVADSMITIGAVGLAWTMRHAFIRIYRR